MEARIIKAIVVLAAVGSLGASHRTANFVVQAPTPQLAKEIGDSAEKYRRELAVEWLGSEMRNWSQPCPIVAQVGENLGAGGATSFLFDRGEVFGWQMEIQGSRERLLDSVLPHEVTHTIFATHFRQPLPRWADEGACTTVEHHTERAKQEKMLIHFLQNKRGIAFSKMFAMREYPADVMPLYSQGFSLARFLIAQGGKRKYVKYVGDGLKSGNWTEITKAHYGYQDLATLQDSWLAWVKQGSPNVIAGAAAPTQLASVESNSKESSRSEPVFRFQSPEADSDSAGQRAAIHQSNTSSTNSSQTSAVDPAGWQAGAAASTSRAEVAHEPVRTNPRGSSIYAQGSRGASMAGTPATASAAPGEFREASRQPIFEWHRK